MIYIVEAIFLKGEKYIKRSNIGKKKETQEFNIQLIIISENEKRDERWEEIIKETIGKLFQNSRI